MLKLTSRSVFASTSVALGAAVAGAFIALAIDGEETTVIQPALLARAETMAPALEAPAAEPPLAVLVPSEGEREVAFSPTHIFQRVVPSVVGVETPMGSGSGFFVDDQGRLITNYHVVQGSDEVMIALGDGSRVPGEVLGSDPDNDLALVKIDPAGLQIAVVHLGDSDALVVGESVAAIGNPFGLERTLTTGVVSAMGREGPPLVQGRDPQQGLIQTDTAINPGNSGGPLINEAGEVIGVTSSAISPVRGSVGVNFAIPVNTLKRFIAEMPLAG